MRNVAEVTILAEASPGNSEFTARYWPRYWRCGVRTSTATFPDRSWPRGEERRELCDRRPGARGAVAAEALPDEVQIDADAQPACAMSSSGDCHAGLPRPGGTRCMATTSAATTSAPRRSSATLGCPPGGRTTERKGGTFTLRGCPTANLRPPRHRCAGGLPRGRVCAPPYAPVRKRNGVDPSGLWNLPVPT